VAGKANASDPLIFNGQRLVPFIGEKLSADAKPFVYFVVYPDKKLTEKPKIQVEFLVDGNVLANQTADLPAPDATGTIPMVVKASTHAGNCELKITALQGSKSAAGALKYSVVSKCAGRGLPTALHDRTKVLIQPVQRLPDQFILRDVVAGIVDDAALVFFRSSQESKHWLL
jgi:hypothetical protein